MDFEDSAGTRYQLTESAEAPAPTKKSVVWPWVVGGLAVAGGLVWMASASTRKANPMTPEIEARIIEARDPETELWRLKELVMHPEVEVRRALLDNPNLCPTYNDGKLNTILLHLLAHEFPEEVGAHPLFVLHALIEPNDEMGGVVTRVVQRIEDAGLIEQLLGTFGSINWYVRQGVARNPRTPVDVLRLLGNQTTESEQYVREAVAKNPSTPVDVLRTLGNPKTESFAYVRATVASNPNTPVDLLRSMTNEQTEFSEFVQETAQKSLAYRGLA